MHKGSYLVVGALSFAFAASCGSSGDETMSAESTGGALLTGATASAGSTGAGVGGASTSVTATSSSSIGVGGSVSSNSSSGSGGAPTCPVAPVFSGPSITAPNNQWTWVDVPGSKCRDGSQSGFGVRMSSSSQKVFIYLEGGGACFNAATCAISATSFGQVDFGAWAGTVGLTGIFDSTQSANPVKDWNAIYVPYCSADVHAGNAANVVVPGVLGNQDFVGFQNIALYLDRIVPTFKSSPQILLTGISAGGFGAAFNYDRVATAFCPQPVVLLDDSGPPMSDMYLAPCLQKQWRGLWNLAATIPADCAACNGANGGGIVNYAPYIAKKWPMSKMGLISSMEDSVISTFYGFGTDNCTASTPLPGAVYAAGLEDLRTNYLSSQWGTYFITSITHTYLLGPGFYTTTVNGTALTSWVGDLLAGKTSNIGP